MDTKTISLTKGKFAVVDDEDFEWLNEMRWQVHDKSKNNYALGKKWLSHTKGITLAMHREIMKKHGFDVEGMEVDHINGDGLDNRKENLRVCKHSENMKNINKNKGELMGNKGVTLVSGHYDLKKPWRTKFTKDYKTIHVGYFATKEEAVIAYNWAVKENFGEFANMNQI